MHCAGVPDEDGLVLDGVVELADRLARVDAVDVVDALADGVAFVDADTHGDGGVVVVEEWWWRSVGIGIGIGIEYRSVLVSSSAAVW